MTPDPGATRLSTSPVVQRLSVSRTPSGRPQKSARYSSVDTPYDDAVPRPKAESSRCESFPYARNTRSRHSPLSGCGLPPNTGWLRLRGRQPSADHHKRGGFRRIDALARGVSIDVKDMKGDPDTVLRRIPEHYGGVVRIV
eukprot:351168-Chlamydomonas_euryale.AAC.6